MPFLSAASSLLLPPDDGFDPITELKGAAIPDYALEFSVIDTYDGKEFAFDKCVDPTHLVSTNAVDERFLLCRYERLFRYKGSAPPTYYLVPWLGIPALGGGTASWDPLDNFYQLKVTRAGWVAKSLSAPSAPKQRKLKIVCSHAGMVAKWASSGSPELLVTDVTKFADQLIGIQINLANYKEQGESIEIQEVLAGGAKGKTVGKVRIVFLKMMEARAFLLRAEDKGSSYRFSRIAPASAPVALESDGHPDYLHGNAVNEANGFGFRQIGLSLVLENAGCDMYDSSDNPMFHPNNTVQTVDIAKPAPNPVEFPTAADEYLDCLERFFSKVAYVKGNAGKKSKYSRFYLIITDVTSIGNPGINLKRETMAASPSKSIGYFGHTIPPNASTFRSIDTAKISPAVITAREDDQVLYRTVVHEVGHACLLHHTFDYPLKVPKQDKKSYYPELTEAHQILSLYIRGSYIKDFVDKFDTDKLSISDFKTTGQRTLFDEIISNGMDKGLGNFIRDTIFSGTIPAYMTAPEYLKSSTELQLADLVIWRSLDDLVKITKANGRSIMDYTLKYAGKNPNGNEYFMHREVVYFNRFQWEIVRKVVERLNALVYDG